MGIDYFNCANCTSITDDGGEVRNCEACEGSIGECCLYKDILPVCKACGCAHRRQGRDYKCNECDCIDHKCEKPTHYSRNWNGGRTCSRCKCEHKSDNCDSGKTFCAGCEFDCDCDCYYSDKYVLCDKCRRRDAEEEEKANKSDDKDETDDLLTVEEKAKGFDILVKRYELDEYEVLGKERPKEKSKNNEEEEKKPNKKRKRRYRRHELDDGLVTDSDDNNDQILDISLLLRIIMKYVDNDFIDSENKSRPGSYYFFLLQDEIKNVIKKIIE